MKNLMNQRKKIKFFFFFAFLFSCTESFVFASDVDVKATIKDIVPPSVPILIEPTDGAFLSDNTPAFKWYESTDNAKMHHYVFYLDGHILYNNIPLFDTDTGAFSLDYNELDGIYTLTPKNGYEDGVHSWGVAAVDYANLNSLSDIWDFTIDTLAPNFVLKKIGDTNVNISAADAGTVPADPIIIFRNDATANEPVLIAYGEANSSVKLTVLIPNDPTQVYNTSVNSSGYYEVKLGILPRNTDIRLDFIITDGVGHVSVLEKVYFRIVLQHWPTSTPTPTVTNTVTTSPTTNPSPTLSKTVSPSISITGKPSYTLTPTSSPTLSPTASITPIPTGIIPIIPPKEIIHEASDEIIETLPDSAATYIREFLSSTLWKDLSLFFALLTLILFYILSFLVLLSKFVADFSTLLLKRVLFLMFPTFFKAKKHLVFEYRETLASPLVKVELVDLNGKVVDFTITNLDGNFNDLDKKDNKNWKLKVKDSNFYYPIGDQKPSQLETWQFYQDQVMDENYFGQPILIPTLRAAGQDRLPFLERLRIFVLYLLDYPIWFLIWLIFFSLIFVMRYQSIYNDLALFFYIFMVLVKLFIHLKKKATLTITTRFADGQQFSNNLILSFFASDSKKAQSLVMPFEFSNSKPINHSFEKVTLTAFSKNITMTRDNLDIGSQVFVLGKEQEQIDLEIKRI